MNQLRCIKNLCIYGNNKEPNTKNRLDSAEKKKKNERPSRNRDIRSCRWFI